MAATPVVGSRYRWVRGIFDSPVATVVNVRSARARPSKVSGVTIVTVVTVPVVLTMRSVPGPVSAVSPPPAAATNKLSMRSPAIGMLLVVSAANAGLLLRVGELGGDHQFRTWN